MTFSPGTMLLLSECRETDWTSLGRIQSERDVDILIAAESFSLQIPL